jgi:hypothetical protein
LSSCTRAISARRRAARPGRPDGDNLVYTTDFRRVYAGVIEGWLGYTRTDELLRGRFEPFALFG